MIGLRHEQRNEILDRAEALIARNQLRWLDYIKRMDRWLSNMALYGELANGKSKSGRQKKRYKELQVAGGSWRGIEPPGVGRFMSTVVGCPKTGEECAESCHLHLQ